METIWIIGAGHFGQLAVKRIAQRKPDCRLVVVDPDPGQLKAAQANAEIIACRGNGIDFLNQYLKPGAQVDWIIPSLPLHMAWEWCRCQLGKNHLKAAPAPTNLAPMLPNVSHDPAGVHLYASHADFICPDNCSEPEKRCSITRKPREQNMYDYIADLMPMGFRARVLRSRQLCPGVGGLIPGELLALAEQIQSHPGKHLVATSCKCHAVVTPALYVP